MPSEVSICNRALQAISARTSIASLTEASVEARNCNLIYADTRDEVLNMAHWNFARKTAYLALLKSAPGTPGNVTSTATQWSTAFPAPPWLFEYAYPTDCIQMWKIMQLDMNLYAGVPLTSNGMQSYPYMTGSGSAFEIGSDADANGQQKTVILTNQYLAIGVYSMRITDPNLFGSQFTEALVQALAAKLALALTGQVALANTKFQQANAIITQARASDGNEGFTVIDNMPDWITARDDYAYSVGLGYTAPYGPLFGVV